MNTKLFSGRAFIGGLAVMVLTLAPAINGHDTAEAKPGKGKHKGWSKQDNWKNGQRKGWSKSRTDWRRWDNDDDRNWRDSRWRDSRWRDDRWDDRRDDRRWRDSRSTSSKWRRSNARSDNWRRSTWQRTNTRNNTWRKNNARRSSLNNWQRTNWRNNTTAKNKTWRLADTDYYRSREDARRAAAYSRSRGYRTGTSYDPKSRRWIVREYLRR